jgi:hypothetical protein
MKQIDLSLYNNKQDIIITHEQILTILQRYF